MQSLTFILLAAAAAVALAEGEFYVPRAYYTIDAEGHASLPVPLRRLRRSFSPYPYPYPSGGGASANANANAEANANGWGGGGANANANANANARAYSEGWGVPTGVYGATNPALSAGQFRHASGPVLSGRSVVASSSVGMDSSGKGYYDQYTGVSN